MDNATQSAFQAGWNLGQLEILRQLINQCHFDGHCVGIYKNELIKIKEKLEAEQLNEQIGLQ